MTVRFEELRAGGDVPALARVVTREDIRAYADASGDPNPLHQDDEVARSVGFPGIIAHGMFTMGHLATCLTSWAGDPGHVIRVSAQFRAPVLMGEEIVARGRIRTIDPATRTVTVELWVTLERDGVTEFAIRKAEAEVRFPS